MFLMATIKLISESVLKSEDHIIAYDTHPGPQAS